jgi:hypothetical protein
MTATRARSGTASFSRPSHLPPTEKSYPLKPVILPPGCLTLATNPCATGSETDTALVVCLIAVTVVDMPGKQTGSDAAVMKEATKVVVEGGVVKFDIEHRVRRVYGRQLGIAGANGGYSYVALFYRIIAFIAFAAGGRKFMRCASNSRSILHDPSQAESNPRE